MQRFLIVEKSSLDVLNVLHLKKKGSFKNFSKVLCRDKIILLWNHFEKPILEPLFLRVHCKKKGLLN